MAHTELDLRERRAIEDMLNAKMSVSEIATEIGRHRSTVYREIKRNGFEDEELPYLNGYYGVNAQRVAAARRARRLNRALEAGRRARARARKRSRPERGKKLKDLNEIARDAKRVKAGYPSSVPDTAPTAKKIATPLDHAFVKSR